MENMVNVKDEAYRCLLCLDAPCTKVCPNGLNPARALRAIRFDNEKNAGRWITSACAKCDAPCEAHCVRSNAPIGIRQVSAIVNNSAAKKAPLETLPDLSVDFCGIKCENPFFLASSAVCINYEMVARAFEMGWAGVFFKSISKTVFKEVSPRFDAVYNGNSMIGFRNMEQTSENSAEENFSIIRRLKENYPNKVVVASIMGANQEEWVYLAKGVEEAGADMIELNFSCPQMEFKGMGCDVGQNPELVKLYSSAVRQEVKIPVIAKMTPNVTDIVPPALAALESGCNAISAINTIKSITMGEVAMVSGKRIVSGYSGKAVKPMALRFIYEMASSPALRLNGIQPQLVGIGGIETWSDALDFIQLGCSMVQVCTAVMQFGYRIIDDLKLGLQSYMAANGIANVSDLVGRALHSFAQANELDRSTKLFPKWNMDKCVGCGRCYVACSDAGHQAITFEGATRKPKMNGKRCVGCHLCRLVCPVNAIEVSNIRIND